MCEVIIYVAGTFEYNGITYITFVSIVANIVFQFITLDESNEGIQTLHH